MACKNEEEGKEWLNINHLPAIRYDLSEEIPRLPSVKGLFPCSCHLTAVGFLMSTTKMISEAENQTDWTSLKRKLPFQKRRGEEGRGGGLLRDLRLKSSIFQRCSGKK